MKNKNLIQYILWAVFAVIVFWVWRSMGQVALPQAAMTAMGSDTVHARVIAIVEEGDIDLGGVVQRYQIARVELLEGEYKGMIVEIDYGKRQILSNAIYLQRDNEIFVTTGLRPDGTLTVYFADFMRSTPLLWLVILFAVIILLISRWKGLRSLLSMAFSLMVIIGYIIPKILTGSDPLQA